MNAFAWLINTVFQVFVYLIIGRVILSWLISFNIINMGNQVVRTIAQITHQLTEPVMRPLRNVIPPMGGLDITPIVALLGAEFLRRLIVPMFM